MLNSQQTVICPSLNESLLHISTYYFQAIPLYSQMVLLIFTRCSVPISTVHSGTSLSQHSDTHYKTTNKSKTPVHVLEHASTKTRSMVSCQKGPTSHAYAWQLGPFWQDTLEIRKSVPHLIVTWSHEEPVLR